MVGNNKVIFLVVFLWSNVECFQPENPVVTTNVGSIRGTVSPDGDYAMFVGIPYAVVDEDNPFGESVPQPNFEETFEANDDSAICPQTHEGVSYGSLNCLHLNIYVPSKAPGNRLAVMVYVHGGGFESGFAGSHIYGPKYFMQHDVILVTLNYRLGPYGFMCLDIPEVRGNQGLKDQMMALQWVKNNIEAFGGDANQITVFGESAGGFSLHLHLISSYDILFNKVILQSGMRTLTNYVLSDPDPQAPLKIAQYLGLETNDAHEALQFLAKSNTNLVVEAVENLGLIFRPCKEINFDGFQPFITSQSIHAKVLKIEDIPVLIGFNEHETVYNYFNEDEMVTVEKLAMIESYLLQSFNFDNETLEQMKTLISDFYFDEETDDVNRTLEIINFDSDITYIHPIQRTVRKYLESGPENIFYYMFSYRSSINLLPSFASHADDLRYLFEGFLNTNRQPMDDVITDRMTTMWTNFAKYSNPTPVQTDLLPVKWLPVKTDRLYYMKIDTNLTLGIRPLHQRMAFWDLFYKGNEMFLK